MDDKLTRKFQALEKKMDDKFNGKFLTGSFVELPEYVSRCLGRGDPYVVIAPQNGAINGIFFQDLER